MNFTPLLSAVMTFFGSAALAGVLFHDMRVDKAVTTAIGIESDKAQVGDGVLRRGHAHTHVHGVDAPVRRSVRMNKDAQLNQRVGARRVHFHFGVDNGIIWPSQ